MSALEIVQLEVGLLQNFCEVIACPRTGQAALVDPAFEVDRLLRIVAERGLGFALTRPRTRQVECRLREASAHTNTHEQTPHIHSNRKH